MGKAKLKVIHNGKGRGWVGSVPNEETYEKLKNGEVDWKEHIKDQMSAIIIPRDLFYRLMALDIYLDEVNEKNEQQTREELGV